MEKLREKTHFEFKDDGLLMNDLNNDEEIEKF